MPRRHETKSCAMKGCDPTAPSSCPTAPSPSCPLLPEQGGAGLPLPCPQGLRPHTVGPGAGWMAPAHQVRTVGPASKVIRVLPATQRSSFCLLVPFLVSPPLNIPSPLLRQDRGAELRLYCSNADAAQNRRATGGAGEVRSRGGYGCHSQEGSVPPRVAAGTHGYCCGR